MAARDDWIETAVGPRARRAGHRLHAVAVRARRLERAVARAFRAAHAGAASGARAARIARGPRLRAVARPAAGRRGAAGSARWRSTAWARTWAARCRKTRRAICWAMCATRACRRPTPTCASTRPASGRPFTPTRPTWWGCCACSPRAAAAPRRWCRRPRCTTRCARAGPSWPRACSNRWPPTAAARCRPAPGRTSRSRCSTGLPGGCRRSINGSTSTRRSASPTRRG